MTKPRWSPLKAGLVVFGLTILIGLVAGVTALMLIDSGASPEARGEKFGQGLAPLSLIAGGIAYFVQKSKLDRDANR